jgi:hypothetical protein
MKIFISSEISKLDSKGDTNEEMVLTLQADTDEGDAVEDIAEMYNNIVKKLKEGK